MLSVTLVSLNKKKIRTIIKLCFPRSSATTHTLKSNDCQILFFYNGGYVIYRKSMLCALLQIGGKKTSTSSKEIRFTTPAIHLFAGVYKYQILYRKSHTNRKSDCRWNKICSTEYHCFSVFTALKAELKEREKINWLITTWHVEFVHWFRNGTKKKVNKRQWISEKSLAHIFLETCGFFNVLWIEVYLTGCSPSSHWNKALAMHAY